MKRALVCGAGGFIGSNLVKRLKHEGYWVRGVDVKKPEFSDTEADEFLLFDLRDQNNYQALTIKSREHFDEIYQLAADMGGAGYVFTGEHDADIMSNSALINLSILSQLQRMDFKGKIFYSSSACMYPQERQNPLDPDRYYDETIALHEKAYAYGLHEDMAYPANPDSEYGWEKLFSERLYLAYARNYGIDVRIARFHNIYGPEGTYKGGKEKAPAAACRKMIEAKCGDDIEVWGDGNQTRSFLYIDDCIDAVRLLMEVDYNQPINIGSEEMVTINELHNIAWKLSKNPGITIKHIDGPVGVRGRNSDNTLIRELLNWEPKLSLQNGLEITHTWIKSEYDRD